MKPQLVVGLACVCFVQVLVTARGDDASKQTQPLRLSKQVKAKCLEVLRAGMQSDEFWPSIHAAEGLTLAGQGDEVRLFLEPKLATEEDDQKRCGLSRELVRAGDWRKARIMLNILAGEETHGHIHAAESLYKVGEIGDGRAMRRAMRGADNIKLLLMSAAALGRCGDPGAMKILREKLKDPDPETHRIAAWILARIGNQSDIAQLRKSLAAATDDITRCYIEHALAALGDKEGLRRLKNNLSDDDAAIRTYASTFAGDARAKVVADDLIRLLKDENVDVRVRAAQSLMVLSRSTASSVQQIPSPAGWNPAPHEEISQLVYPATKENPRYTEGSIVRLGDGALLYAVTQFVGGGSDFARAQIVARKST
ncbi:MAG: HEAT repeat domain-containing protein, partial [Pirellulaceae bacterium]|nr:HEAT repeat domain-containing protein [Pirellulaceae bacterium]